MCFSFLVMHIRNINKGRQSTDDDTILSVAFMGREISDSNRFKYV